jgi:DNA topoisomerase-3
MELVVSELRSPELTAKWERQLEQIARGKGDMEGFLQGIRQQTCHIVKEVKTSSIEYKPHNVTGSKCPECGQNLQEFKGKKGKVLVCPERSCGYRRSAEKQLSNKRCPQCKKKMEIRTGKAGKFFQCKPCNVIEMLNDQKKGKMDKRESRKLMNKYSGNDQLTSSLGDALKAALENKDD